MRNAKTCTGSEKLAQFGFVFWRKFRCFGDERKEFVLYALLFGAGGAGHFVAAHLFFAEIFYFFGKLALSQDGDCKTVSVGKH